MTDETKPTKPRGRPKNPETKGTWGGKREGAGGKPEKMTPFREWAEKNGHTRETLAPLLGMHPYSVASLLNGNKKPSIEIAAKIEKLSEGELTAVSWVTDL